MDILGVEIKSDSLSVAHLRSTAFGARLEGYHQFKGKSEAEHIEELKFFISSNGLKDARIAVGLSRASSITRTLEVPALSAESIAGIIKYEVEKHLPLMPDESYYSYEVIRKDKKVISLLLSAALRNAVDDTVSSFRSAGLEPFWVGAWQACFFNALCYWKKVSQGRNTAFVSLNGGMVTVDAFKGMTPVYSSSFHADGPRPEQWIEALSNDVRFSQCCMGVPLNGRRIDECMVISEEPLPDGLLSMLPEEGMWVDGAGSDKGVSMASASAVGAALAASGRGMLGASLAPGSAFGRAGRKRAFFSWALPVAAVVLLSAVGASYIIRDRIEVKRLESAVYDLKMKNEKVRDFAERVSGMNARIKALEEIDGANRTGTLDILKELTETLPAGTWLTGFEYEKGAVTIDGFSDGTSSLLLKMGRSPMFRDAEFTGPVVKAEGKERFKIRFRLMEKTERGR